MEEIWEQTGPARFPEDAVRLTLAPAPYFLYLSVLCKRSGSLSYNPSSFAACVKSPFLTAFICTPAATYSAAAITPPGCAKKSVVPESFNRPAPSVSTFPPSALFTRPSSCQRSTAAW